MKELFLLCVSPILLISLAGCSLLPPSSAMPTPTHTPAPVSPSSYEPQPEDNKLQRDQVYLDLQNSPLVIRESLPGQVSLILNGYLSNPCHKLRVMVTPANPQHEIRLDVYSVYDPRAVCITMLHSFNATIPLGSYSSGHYTVYVNDELVAEFDS